MPKKDYWKDRAGLLYYPAVFQVVSAVGADARSIIDVGSADTDYLTWFYWIDRKVQLNLDFKKKPPAGVERITSDFLAWEPEAKFDIALCLQVLEHVPDPISFCAKLKSTAPILVVSVPYKWPAGRTKGHLHDPVDERKLLSWMKVSPNLSMIVPEPFGRSRLIAYYDIARGPEYKLPAKIAREEKARRTRGD